MDRLRIAAHSDDATVAAELRKLLPNASIAFLRSCLHQAEPFAELAFFNRDHEENVGLARKIVSTLQLLKVEPILLRDDKTEPMPVRNLENKFKSWETYKKQEHD